MVNNIIDVLNYTGNKINMKSAFEDTKSTIRI